MTVGNCIRPFLGQFVVLQRHVGGAEVDGLGFDLLDAGAGADRLVVDLDAGGLVVVGGPLGIQGRREAGAGAGHVLGGLDPRVMTLCWRVLHGATLARFPHAKRYPPRRRRPRLQQLPAGDRPVDHGQIQRVEYLKETVRQGNGLDEARNLTTEAMERGWDCLARFRRAAGRLSSAQVRAVATQTLREARNRDEFLLRARTRSWASAST
jgi:hypothetical protein